LKCNDVLQEVDIEKELGVELGLGHDDDDEAEEEKHEGASCKQLFAGNLDSHSEQRSVAQATVFCCWWGYSSAQQLLEVVA
jgi:hypothetical protein